MKLGFNLIQVVLVKFFGASSYLLLTVLVTNYMPQSNAGIFLFSLTIIQILGTLITFGSHHALLKLVASRNESDWLSINVGISSVIRLVVGVGLIVFILSLTFPEAISELLGQARLVDMLPIVSISSVVFGLSLILSSCLIGLQKTNLSVFLHNILPQLLFSFCVMLMFFFDFEITSMSKAYMVSLLTCFFIGVRYWLTLPNSKILLLCQFPESLKYSLSSFFVFMVMVMCIEWAGQFATARYLSSEDIALYTTAQRASMLASFTLIAVNLVIAPQFASAFSKNNCQLVNRISLVSSRFVLILAFPLLCIMMSYPEIIMGLFGREYTDAAPLLQILAVGQFINVITGSVGYLLNMTGHEKDMRNVVLFSGPLAIVLAFGLTSHFGLMGAAYATAISVATQNLLAVWMVKKRLGFNTLNIFRKVA